MDPLFGIDVINKDTGEREQYDMRDQQTYTMVSNLQNSITQFENTLNGLNDMYKALRENFVNLNANYESLGEELSDSEYNLQVTNAELTSAKKKFDQLQTSLTPVTAEIEGSTDYVGGFTNYSTVSGRILLFNGDFLLMKDVPINSVVLTIKGQTIQERPVYMRCGTKWLEFLVKANGEVRNQKKIALSSHSDPVIFDTVLGLD